jgi:hypothetical protein
MARLLVIEGKRLELEGDMTGTISSTPNRAITYHEVQEPPLSMKT